MNKWKRYALEELEPERDKLASEVERLREALERLLEAEASEVVEVEDAQKWAEATDEARTALSPDEASR